PGLIFPPEGIKIGMLPDVFYPAEPEPGRFGPEGVTVISRSGAILYHLSDAMVSTGIAQNAVLGVGGDGAIGTTFKQIVPIVMKHPHTHLVVVAGEIGGCQEELLAKDIKDHPEKYPKPLVALISGAQAPKGKTMGHAGAVVSPGQEYGTFCSKKQSLTEAGVVVVNSQTDLIEAVKEKLGGRTYFEVKRYYQKMASIWDAPPPKTTWSTFITRVEPNHLLVRGYPLPELIENNSYPEVLHLLITGSLPDQGTAARLGDIMCRAAGRSLPPLPQRDRDDLSKTITRLLICDTELAENCAGSTSEKADKAAMLAGRTLRAVHHRLWENQTLFAPLSNHSELISLCLTGKAQADDAVSRLLEAMLVACVDHGVTPPSAQATILAASVRAALEVAVANGVSAITDVHGGAGAKAAVFFRFCLTKAETDRISPGEAAREIVQQYVQSGRRIEGLGHRVHTLDPRRDVLWSMAEKTGVAAESVELSQKISTLFRSIRGMDLPINVDGVIGAIIADLGLPEALAKAVFILGRIAGLTAHYFEEVSLFPPMRRINFSQAKYAGKK
ncbi:MAG: citrate/2-methylcitrate synthase, partial [bacterium]|nr:citrate/2-methylcitrate synthase [bacterium]